MKRRSFIQWCLGVFGVFVVGTVGVPKAKAKDPGAYTQEDIDSACAENPLMRGEEPIEFRNYDENIGVHTFFKPILHICAYRDYIYVLLEGGEIWRAWEGGEYFGKPCLTWQQIDQVPYYFKRIEDRGASLLVAADMNFCGRNGIEFRFVNIPENKN